MRAFLQRDDLTATEQLQVILLFGRHIPVFRYVLRPPEQLLTAADRLRLDPNAKPEFTRQYPMAQSKLQEARRIIEELVRQGVVEAASSDWNSPMVLVPKKILLLELVKLKHKLKTLQAITIKKNYKSV